MSTMRVGSNLETSLRPRREDAPNISRACRFSAHWMAKSTPLQSVIACRLRAPEGYKNFEEKQNEWTKVVLEP